MRRFLALLLGLALVLPATAQKDKSSDTDPRARAVAPFVGELTFAVVHVDLTKIDLDALLDRLGKIGKVEEERIATTKAEAGKGLKALRDAGVRDVYVVLGLEGFPTQPSIVAVLPLGKNADAAAVANLQRQIGDSRHPTARIGNALVVGDKAALERLKNRKPTPHPALAKAFAAAGDGAVQVVVLLPQTLRRALEESLPELPKEVGGGSVETITRGFSWAAAGVNLKPEYSLRVIIQAKNAKAAKALARLYDSGLHVLARELARDKYLHESFPEVGALRKLLTPKLADSRLTLALNEKQLNSLLVPLLARTRQEAKRAESLNNLRQMALAMHNYHDTYGSFPAHASYSKQGKPLLSWRVLILPFVEQQALYQQFHLDEPWDSEHNKKLIAQMPPIYRDPLSKAGAGKTTYVVPVGKATMFPPGPKGVKIKDVPDGTSNTLMIVTADDAHAVIWTKPDDLPYDPKEPFKGLAGKARGWFLAAFADGSARAISRTIKPDTLRALFTRNGGEVIGNVP